MPDQKGGALVFQLYESTNTYPTLHQNCLFSSTWPFPVILDQKLAHIDPSYAMSVTKISRNLVPQWFQDMVVPTCFQPPIKLFWSKTNMYAPKGQVWPNISTSSQLVITYVFVVLFCFRRANCPYDRASTYFMI